MLAGHHFLVLAASVELEHSPRHGTCNRLQQRVQGDQITSSLVVLHRLSISEVVAFLLASWSFFQILHRQDVVSAISARGQQARVGTDLQTALSLAGPTVRTGAAERFVGADRGAARGACSSGAEESARLEVSTVPQICNEGK